MSETEPKWQSIIDLIIPHLAAPQVLVLYENGAWCLPRTQVDQQWPHLLLFDRVNTAIHQQLGLNITILGQLVEHSDEATHEVYCTYLCENHSPDWAPSTNGRWIGTTNLEEVEFALPAQQAALAAHLAQVETDNLPSLRVPWARPGWYATAVAWIQAQLTQLGYHIASAEADSSSVIIPIQQVKHWFLACVMRIATNRGYVYFKASGGSPLFAKEASAMHELARIFPQYVPAPLAIDAEREWMLLADFGPPVGWAASIETRATVLRRFGRLQIAAAAHIDELIAMGCLDRRLDKLAAQVDALFNDATMLAYVSEAQGEQLRALGPKLKAICVELAGYNVPQTLVHGDMHMDNVARQGESFLFFDWTDACIAHPFLDMIDILHEKDAALQVCLRDAYLAEWTAYEPIERLLAMWTLAQPLCALHQAVSYQAILTYTEPAMQFEMAWAMPFWFGKILDAQIFGTIKIGCRQ